MPTYGVPSIITVRFWHHGGDHIVAGRERELADREKEIATRERDVTDREKRLKDREVPKDRAVNDKVNRQLPNRDRMGSLRGANSSAPRPPMRPAVNTPRPTVNAPRPAMRPAVNAPRPEMRPAVSAPRPSMNVARPAVSAPRPSMNASRPAVSPSMPSVRSGSAGGRGVSSGRGSGGRGSSGRSSDKSHFTQLESFDMVGDEFDGYFHLNNPTNAVGSPHSQMEMCSGSQGYPAHAPIPVIRHGFRPACALPNREQPNIIGGRY